MSIAFQTWGSAGVLHKLKSVTDEGKTNIGHQR